MSDRLDKAIANLTNVIVAYPQKLTDIRFKDTRIDLRDEIHGAIQEFAEAVKQENYCPCADAERTEQS